MRNERLIAWLRLHLTEGLGPVRTRRLIDLFGDAERACSASPAELRRVEGIGEKLSLSIAASMARTQERAERELELARQEGVTVLCRDDAGYPSLLKQMPDGPTVLYVRGTLDDARDRYAVAIVGSRGCTAYGLEQGGRFGKALAHAGLTIVSGGAAGIDSAAHRGALEMEGRTIAVMGCGLCHVYPPQNRELFERVSKSGAVVSEFAMETPPREDNFPKRNRVISGLSLGVIVIEAGRGSGSLITAKIASDDHGREVMAVPGRVDSPSSAGTHDLLKEGGAHLVTEPGDVISILETPARHVDAGKHADRYAAKASESAQMESDGTLASNSLFAQPAATRVKAPTAANETGLPMSETQQAILAALAQRESATLEELARDTSLAAGVLRSELTMLEITRRVKREGNRISRVKA
ncbi:MAG TPA: DNA-processing protein DprA [Phycisphaerales bacterium]|nr:DNA-processing protein DprA [Phycisphaerales bacterium]